MEIRQAKLSDRQTFLNLWKEYLLDREKSGGTVLPSDDNLLAYLGLFESYIAGSLFGFTLLATEDGQVIGLGMGGEVPENGLRIETKLGRTITTWGVYVLPEYRQKGIAKTMQDRANTIAAGLGFDTVLSYLVAGEPVSKANALNWGLEILEHVIASPLGNPEDKEQGDK
jgi:GNAT superfamily N-acetyltransferase